MARKYSRDNRGRFASAGGGATARGGRLKTAAGNKRKTQTAIIRSAGSKQAGKDLLKASQKSFKVNAPTRFGGENQGYATPRGKAADQGRVAAFRNLKAAQRKGGLPASGGAMRVKGGIKRDPGAAAKLASRAKPARAAAKGRVATMRRVNRARANKDRTADTRNIPGSAMKRRPSQKTTRANNLADRALSFYSNPAKALQAVKKSRRGFRLPRGMR
jgi:hypothetical protein